MAAPRRWRSLFHPAKAGWIEAWAPIFFGAGNIGAGLYVIVALWLSIAWALREFAAVKSGAAWLLVPYLMGVSFESWLNLSIWKLNP